jgi:hypothetical protein
MQSRGARIGVAVVAVVVVVVLFFLLREGDGDDGGTTSSVAEETTQDEGAGSVVNPTQKPKPEPPPEVVTAEIEVNGGQPVGGVQEIEIPAGEKAEIVVTSADTTEEVHFHGYDLSAELAPGEPAKIEFEATIDGVFEMELEESVTPIAEVTVD